jgi:hypothetical protein
MSKMKRKREVTCVEGTAYDFRQLRDAAGCTIRSGVEAFRFREDVFVRNARSGLSCKRDRVRGPGPSNRSGMERTGGPRVRWQR